VMLLPYAITRLYARYRDRMWAASPVGSAVADGKSTTKGIHELKAEAAIEAVPLTGSTDE